MNKKDYIDVVVNFLSDSAGSIPLIGSFITAVINSGYNIAEVKQKERILRFLEELEKRVDKIEEKFKILVTNERFEIHFYKSLYLIRDTFDEDQFNAYLGFISKYFENEETDFEMDITFEILNAMSPYSWKLLKQIYRDMGEKQFNARKYFLPNLPKKDISTSTIDYEDIDYNIHKSLADLINLELLQSKKNITSSLQSIGWIGSLKVSKKGVSILNLLKEKI